MRGILAILLAVAFSAPPQQTAPSSLPVDSEVVKKSLVFLTYEHDDFEVVGTGFLISIPVTGDPAHSHVAIVTSRHFIDPQWAGCSWSNPSALTVRIGIWQDSFTLEWNGQKTWLAHADDKVDVAIIPFDGRLGRIINKDVKTLPVSDFSTKEEIEKFHLGIGTNVVSAILIPDLFDMNRNYPAFTFGKVSSVSDDTGKLRCGTGPLKDRLSWIIAGKFVPGNSGSPVFLMPLEFALGPALQFSSPRNMILGLVSGNVEGADFAEMVPIEYVFQVIAKYYPDANLYPEGNKDKPQSEGRSPAQRPKAH
jgi:hypothetical protein